MASGQVLTAFFPPGEPPSANYGTFDTRNNRPVIDFDASTLESVCFTGVMPSNYAGGGIKIRIIWSASTATSGDAIWNARIERIDDENLDTDADSFGGSTNSTAQAAPATSGQVQYTDISLGSDDGVIAGELFRVYVAREAAHGSDTMAGDAEIHSVVVLEQ